MDNMLYNKYLLNLLSNMEDNNDFHNELKVNIYLTLLSLNNHNYKEEYYQNEINTIEDYLRRTNNLKVKIQLKRKDDEIDNLIKNLEKIYDNNKRIIDKYNKDNLNIDDIIKSKDPIKLTNLIDKLTKEKLSYTRNKDKYDNIRNLINNLDCINNYYIKDNKIYITINPVEHLDISISDFYAIFDYLLNIDNYNQVYINSDNNLNHKKIISELINIVTNNDKLNNKLLIPVILSRIINNNIPNYENIDTSSFKIDNIKITDLYSFANSKINNTNTAKWEKILIPNKYLYSKIKDIINRGMYYYNDNYFILENIGNNLSDFKLSIDINSMQTFLKDNLLNIINEGTIM